MLIIRLERVPVLDASGAAAIGELVRRAGLAGTRVIVCAARPEVLAMLDRAHVGDHDDRFIRTATYAQAIASAHGKCSLPHLKEVSQE